MDCVSRNNRFPAFALKLDVRKFFDSIPHKILLGVLRRRIDDQKVMNLCENIIDSFSCAPERGLPLGNITSQLFANIYMHEFDFYIKHTLKVRHYLRYCDDFILVDSSPLRLASALPCIRRFPDSHLKLALHEDKIILRKYSQGIDFLGYVTLPAYRILRTRTKRRILRRAKTGMSEQAAQSYLGVLSHCAGHKIKKQLCF
jgi:hypothetical protein